MSQADSGRRAGIGFHCPQDNCTGTVEFDLEAAPSEDFQAVCPVCHRPTPSIPRSGASWSG